MATTKDTKSNPLRVGVLIVESVQFLDLSTIDLFGMLTPEYLQACGLPAPLVNLGIPVKIHYISSLPSPSPSPSSSSSSSNPNPTPASLVELTASAAIRVTDRLDSSQVAPGTLDVILIPGPDPSLPIHSAIGPWLSAHYERGGATLLSVCTGISLLASSGLLQGREATGPRALLSDLGARHPGVKWVDRRWCRSGAGRVWSSGGITNGLDMVAAYLREMYPGPLSNTVCMMADVGDRGCEYRTARVVSNGLWLWDIVRAWWARKVI